MISCPIDAEGTKCVILPDEINEKTKSGLLWLPPGPKDEHQMAVTHGTLVRVGPRAEICWNSDPIGDEVPAQIGDRIIFVKYAGTIIKWGAVIYQIIQDQDVIARMLEEPPETDGMIITPKSKDIVVPRKLTRAEEFSGIRG